MSTKPSAPKNQKPRTRNQELIPVAQVRQTAEQRRAILAEQLALGVSLQEAGKLAGYKQGSGFRRVVSFAAKHPAVVARVNELRAKAATETVLKIEEAKALLTRQVRFDPRAFIAFQESKDLEGKGTGQFFPTLDLQKAQKEGVLDLIEGFEITDKGGLKVKFPDRLAAIDRFAKLSGWNAAEKVEVKAGDDKKFPPGFLEFAMAQMNGGKQKAEGGTQEATTA